MLVVMVILFVYYCTLLRLHHAFPRRFGKMASKVSGIHGNARRLVSNTVETLTETIFPGVSFDQIGEVSKGKSDVTVITKVTHYSKLSYVNVSCYCLYRYLYDDMHISS